MQVCNTTTPAQYFHLLRRQIKASMKMPLVVMTPKSLLRHPDAKSPKADFLKGKFSEVLNDPEISNKKKIKRIILTSGKLYYELNNYKIDNKIDNASVIRIEQFYPYPSKQISRILNSYPAAKEIIWVQEEPKNMGAWNFLSHRLVNDIPKECSLNYIGRPESASPAAGSSKISNRQQKKIIRDAFNK
jgi:2-oxoglutarate dehydrogenase E1 component